METLPTNKTFWQRPEGKTGMFFLFIILAGLGYGLLLLMPAILLALQTTAYATAIAIGLFVTAIVLLDSRFQNGMKALFQIAMKKLTGWIVELDPIAIIEGYLRTLEESLQKMSTQLDLLHGQKSKLEIKIRENEVAIEKHTD